MRDSDARHWGSLLLRVVGVAALAFAAAREIQRGGALDLAAASLAIVAGIWLFASALISHLRCGVTTCDSGNGEKAKRNRQVAGKIGAELLRVFSMAFA
jgi:hypothetical protein